MENFDGENIDELLEIHQYFPIKILRRTVYFDNDTLHLYAFYGDQHYMYIVVL